MKKFWVKIKPCVVFLCQGRCRYQGDGTFGLCPECYEEYRNWGWRQILFTGIFIETWLHRQKEAS